MREIVRTATIQRAPQSLWSWICAPENLDKLFDCLGWKASGYRHAFASGNAPARGMVPGAELSLTKPSGKEFLRWTAADCVPPSRLTLFGQRQGWLDGMHAKWSFELDPLDSGKTELRIRFVLVFHSTWMELLAFNPLASALYARGVDKMIETIKSAP